jgi:hypothetical protein
VAEVEEGDAVGEVHDEVHVVLDQEDGGGARDVADEGLEGVDRQPACRPNLPRTGSYAIAFATMSGCWAITRT